MKIKEKDKKTQKDKKLKDKRVSLHKSSQKSNHTKLKFSTSMEKYYKRMLSSQNRFDQVENALLTLQFADNLLRERMKSESNSVFSVLTETIHRNSMDILKLQSLLDRLFSHQRAYIKKHQKAEPLPTICSQVKDILQAADFITP